MKKHKITIPQPCTENWNKMSPSENGRFCLSCSKTVVDFTSMLPDEIQHFFIQNQNERICGRFRKSQLDSITVQIPNRILYAQTNYYKMFLLALFIAMGTTLFSCQSKDGNKKKIEKVEVVADTTKEKTVVLGMGLPPKSDLKDTIKQEPAIQKVDKIKYVKSENDSKLKTDKNRSSCQSSSTKSEKINSKKNSSLKEPIYVTGEVVSETNAEFPGGIDQFYTFFAKEFKRPEDSDAAKTRLSFAVEKNGSVSFLECSPAVDEAIENEIIRVLKLCPKWQPGQSDGKKVKRQYSLPITLQ